MTRTAAAVFMSAGDPSGDVHGAQVARELRRRRPGIRLVGLAGPRMADAGVETLADFDRLTVMGFAEVLRHLPFFWRLLRRARAVLREADVRLVLPIDYPGFNMRLCRAASRLELPVLYFIAPQVWAWRRSRARHLAEHTDRLAVILPFEEQLFRDAGVDARYVGHPLLDGAPPLRDRATFAGELGLSPEAPILALFPGSRPQEVARHLDLFKDAAERARSAMPALQPVLAVADAVAPAAYDSAPYPRTARSRELLGHAHVALVKSGTGTLEAALAGVPTVIAYRTHPLTFMLARRLVDLPHIGLANLVAGERVAPEHVQRGATPAALADSLLGLAREGPERDRALTGMRAVRRALDVERDGADTAAARVADLAVELMDRRHAG